MHCGVYVNIASAYAFAAYIMSVLYKSFRMLNPLLYFIFLLLMTAFTFLQIS